MEDEARPDDEELEQAPPAEEKDDEQPAGPSSKVKRDSAGRRIKGRGSAAESAQMPHRNSHFESIPSSGSGPAKSVEGWILFITGLGPETKDDDIHDKFCDYGFIKNLHLNLDRRTGFVKGYALVEYEHYEEAKDAIDACDGEQILGETIHVDWAFSRGPGRRQEGGGRRGDGRSRRESNDARERQY